MVDAKKYALFLKKVCIIQNKGVYLHQQIKTTRNMKTNYTYDVHFNDEYDSNSKGMNATIEECRNYIDIYNGTSESYFADYKGGTVSIVCNETGETVYEEVVR